MLVNITYILSTSFLWHEISKNYTKCCQADSVSNVRTSETELITIGHRRTCSIDTHALTHTHTPTRVTRPDRRSPGSEPRVSLLRNISVKFFNLILFKANDSYYFLPSCYLESIPVNFFYFESVFNAYYLYVFRAGKFMSDVSFTYLTLADYYLDTN